MQSPGPPTFNLGMNSDVMVVGEPSLMGGEFGFEDERFVPNDKCCVDKSD